MCSAEPSKQITNSVDRKRPRHLTESQRTAPDLVFAYQCRYRRKFISFFLSFFPSFITVHKYTVTAWQTRVHSPITYKKNLLELKLNSVFCLNLYFRYVISKLFNNERFSLFGFVHLKRNIFFSFCEIIDVLNMSTVYGIFGPSRVERLHKIRASRKGKQGTPK